jgi:hypothetical protein
MQDEDMLYFHDPSHFDSFPLHKTCTCVMYILKFQFKKITYYAIEHN